VATIRKRTITAMAPRQRCRNSLVVTRPPTALDRRPRRTTARPVKVLCAVGDVSCATRPSSRLGAWVCIAISVGLPCRPPKCTSAPLRLWRCSPSPPGRSRHSGDPGCGRQTRRPRRGLAQPPVGVPSGTPTAGIDFGSPAGRQGQRSHPTNAVLDRRSAARSSALGFARSLEQGRAAGNRLSEQPGNRAVPWTRSHSAPFSAIQRHSATYRYISIRPPGEVDLNGPRPEAEVRGSPRRRPEDPQLERQDSR